MIRTLRIGRWLWISVYARPATKPGYYDIGFRFNLKWGNHKEPLS